MRHPSPAINKIRRATHQGILFITESLDVTPKTTEQNLLLSLLSLTSVIVRIYAVQLCLLQVPLLAVRFYLALRRLL